MPKRKDIKKILIIGSGPIVIGQAAEFDYSGTQACKALKEEGYKVILVNSNPATIMTDPDLADRTYVEPLEEEILEKIIEKERPDALLPTVGGQTALNLTVKLAEKGVLDKYNVKLIGANVEAIKKAEDRELFRQAMLNIGMELPKSYTATNLQEALDKLKLLQDDEYYYKYFGYKLPKNFKPTKKSSPFPVIIRPSFTLGGYGGGIAYNYEEFKEKVEYALECSPIHEVLIEESVLGWKEFELEVMRDLKDNVVIICSIENFDPMGVHTGDSITVAPAQTLTDKEYQILRTAAQRIIREIGVETGGSNIQFAVNPKNGKVYVIEMNPRVSRSSALASKATGFPIAKIAAKLAVGYTLDELPNDITKKTPASFEPAIDYVVVKFPRFAFEKFPKADNVLTTTMKSVGEVMAIGRTFKEAFLKAIGSLEMKPDTPIFEKLKSLPIEEIKRKIAIPNSLRVWYIFEALRRNISPKEISELSKIDIWFIYQLYQVILLEKELEKYKGKFLEDLEKDEKFEKLFKLAKTWGFSDKYLTQILS